MTYTTDKHAPDTSELTPKRSPAQIKKDYEDIRQECREKLSAYDNNQAHAFLRERGYGTDQYSYSFFQRWLDGLLAKRINYSANRQNELMLLAMHARNEELYGKRER
ncbi:hypothetical protein [Pseudomonas brassicacearum]|uniref:Uncharacterized protein n=1 Tax=Pseudomonas brassicacearum TaxID=930166 RepID=A0A423GU28_9PSED|nr:hypothetical protein [Pseudomonas brassicacearum]RON00703.1 hypothetical protein BK658_09260 [Pseudomonas brassicacearum]